MKLVALALALFATHAAAQDAPAPGEVYVEALAYNGSGCPQGTVAQNLSPDAKALTLLFSDFIVSTNQQGGRPKKSCNVNVRLHVPQGWVYTLFSVDYRGYMTLADDDSEARLRSWYSLDGSEQIRISNLKVEGPIQQDFTQRAWVPLDALPWLQCNRPSSSINISTELMVEGRNALLTVDSIDGELKQLYGVAWKRCSNSSSWAGQCQAVLESVWGTDMQKFQGTASGRSFDEAKNGARSSATSQCEAARARLRPLIQATTRCLVEADLCVARPR